MKKFIWEDDGYFNVENRDLKQILTVQIVVFLLNILVTIIKIGTGLWAGSLSIVADGLDSMFDALSHIAGFIGLYFVSRPPDAEYPYGHRKFETIAAISIAFLLFLTSWQLLLEAWQRYRDSSVPQVNIWVLVSMLVSMAIQAGTSFYEVRSGRRLKSEFLVADGLHTRASIFVSLAVLVGLGFVWLGFTQADEILAAFVALVIAKIGLDILRENLPVLVDQAAIDPNKIARVVSEVPGVKSFHRVRSRGAQGSAAVDLHVRVSPDCTLHEGDAIATEVRKRLLEIDGVIDVTVHLEAQRKPLASRNEEIFTLARRLAANLGFVIHEAWAQRIDDELYLEFHIGVDPTFTLGQAHALADRFEHDLRAQLPEVLDVHTHIEMASTEIQNGDRVSIDLEKAVRSEIERVIANHPAISNPTNILVRRVSGDDEGFRVSLACEVAGDTPVTNAHYLSTIIERDLSSRLPGVVDVFVHLEPSKIRASGEPGIIQKI